MRPTLAIALAVFAGCSHPAPGMDAAIVLDAAILLDASDVSDTIEVRVAGGCDARGLDLASDPRNCGACGHACAAPSSAIATCIAGACSFDCVTGAHHCNGGCALDTDPLQCGTACAVCSAPNGSTALCAPTGCSFTCPSGQHPCSLSCVDDTSPSNCGTSCDPCPALPNATVSCDGSSCGFACNSGFHVCNGACATDRSAASCGTACTACAAMPNTVATCVLGSTCTSSCAPAFGDCDGIAANGCETDLTTASNCGACGTSCSGVCLTDASGAHCAATCGATMTTCGTACVDTTQDVAHCANCGTQCASPVNATATCTASACGLACLPGFADCDGDPTTGCEVDALNDSTNCGACGVECPLGERCVGGSCACRTGVSLAADVQPIFTTTCATSVCHGGLVIAEMLSLESGMSRAHLVNITSASCPPNLLVQPGAPDHSYLINKLTGDAICNGGRMPLDESALTPDQIDLIARWICEGAPDN